MSQNLVFGILGFGAWNLNNLLFQAWVKGVC